jgi:predicted amidophosphoribosyltransferase
MAYSPSQVAHDTWSVLSPVWCAGCDLPGETLCHRCQGALRPHVTLPTLAIRRALFDVPVVAGITYQGVARSALVAYKDRGVTGLRWHLARPLLAAWRQLTSMAAVDGAILVCVPHQPGSWVKRGRHPTRELVCAARTLRDRLAPDSALRHRRNLLQFVPESDAQKTRTRRQRLDAPVNMVASNALSGRLIVLVDDVITTGITLEHAARAVRDAGGVVVGAVAVASTPSRHQLT